MLIEEDGGVADSSSSSSGSSKPCLIPKHVQIVDVENHTDSIRPYNEYVIVVKKGDGGELVKGHWWRKKVVAFKSFVAAVVT